MALDELYPALSLSHQDMIDLLDASDRQDWIENYMPSLKRADNRALNGIAERIWQHTITLTLPNAVAAAIHDEHSDLPF